MRAKPRDNPTFHPGKVVRVGRRAAHQCPANIHRAGVATSCPSLFDGRGRGKLSMDLRACGCLLDLFVVLGTSDVVEQLLVDSSSTCD